MNLETFIKIIKHRNSSPNFKSRILMLELGTIIQSDQFKERIDRRANNFIIESISTGLKSNSRFIQALCGTILYRLSQDYRYLRHITKILFNINESIAYDVANLNAITNLLFNVSDKRRNVISSIFPRNFQRRLFLQILEKTKNLAHANQVLYANKKSKSKHVAILIQQFLKPPHAPTTDALEFARILIEDFGKEIKIINTCEFNTAVNGAIVPPFKANVIRDYSRIQHIFYSGHRIAFFQPEHTGFEDQGIIECLKSINAFCPEMILTVGCRNVLSELYSDSIFSFMYPTAAGLPLTKNNYFHTWQTATEETLKIAEEEGIGENYLFGQHPGFGTPRRIKQLTRNELGISENAFVYVVVGMRLHNVVDDAFLDLLEEILCEPIAHVLFVGYFNAYDNKLDKRDRLKGRSTFANFQDDIMAVYDLCDCYINPKQPGGGSAIVYAMAAGLPSLSLPYGDGGLAVKKLPEIKNYTVLSSVAKRLCRDKQFYEHYKSLTEKVAQELSSRSPLANKVMDAFSAYKKGSLLSKVAISRG